MNQHSIGQDQGARNRRAVLAEILRQPGLSRTEVGQAVGLNVASVSRITRDLLNAGLIRETDSFGPKGRPGRRFVGLRINGEGGFIIGIGMNAFRQSVTLADLDNRKVAEWVSQKTPDKDGEAFLRSCLQRARNMVSEHVTDPHRFFGVGMAIAAEIDKKRGHVLRAPIFGWDRPIAATDIVWELLGVPLVLDTPPSAINKAESYYGLGKGVTNLMTLHCSLHFGIGVRHTDDSSGSIQEFGRVLNHSKAPDGSGRTLSEACGGLAILEGIRGKDTLYSKTDAALSAMLMKDINRADRDVQVRAILNENGQRTVHFLSLVLDMYQPYRILLAGPLASSPDYVAGFKHALATKHSQSANIPDVYCSEMTPTGASRWLALHGNVATSNLNLTVLKKETAA